MLQAAANDARVAPGPAKCWFAFWLLGLLEPSDIGRAAVVVAGLPYSVLEATGTICWCDVGEWDNPDSACPNAPATGTWLPPKR